MDDSGVLDRSISGSTTIDCSDCVMQFTDHCKDCLVSFICGREADDAVIVDVAEIRAVRMLSRAGLVPSLQHVSRTG